MDARLIHATLLAAALSSLGAGHRTQNFVVDAPTTELAQEIGKAAEKYRRELAIDWLGKEMPPWAHPCMLTVQVSPELGAGGATSFVFDRGEVFSWRMTIQGSRERILDSVLPHEVTHTVFACHFRQALPRWADEGACTTVEHPSERAKQQQMLITFLKTGRGISFSRMFAMREYPQDVLPLYSQGYSLARYLIAQGGKKKFLDFVGQGMEDENWTAAVSDHYGYGSLLALQNKWLDWVRQGSPKITPRNAPEGIASAGDDRRQWPEANLIYRAQSADTPASPPRLVPVERPAELASRTTPGDSTYKRGAAAARQFGAPSESESLRPAEPAAAPARSLERTQPPERSRQILLQWSRAEDSPAATTPPREPILDASLGEGLKWR